MPDRKAKAEVEDEVLYLRYVGPGGFYHIGGCSTRGAVFPIWKSAADHMNFFGPPNEGMYERATAEDWRRQVMGTPPEPPPAIISAGEGTTPVTRPDPAPQVAAAEHPPELPPERGRKRSD